MTYQDHNQMPVGEPVDNWQPRPFPPHTVMQGHYCRLEPLDIDRHTEDLFNAFAADPSGKGWTYLFSEPFTDRVTFNQWLETTCTGQDPLFFTVIDESTNKAVGMASYLRITPEMGVIEVGHIHFSTLMQRTPVSTEAMFLMMQRVFDELGYRRYEWKCDSRNEPSKKAAARLGFTFEGIFRQAILYKGRNRDTAWLSVIDKEWPALKKAFQLWLAPENFDAKGQQHQSLQEMQALQK
ncbi:GNAT family N-acetyltransferase [Aliamphritea hakodatensis]|uniref:GNAT family N-acetyltransferase n=1 Tax=Aliamphritea hakodatensis TaxID=2895352 RepID=UPI0022FD5CAD|nr:GNAT family protein [Aliamphritea hakodatensis]